MPESSLTVCITLCCKLSVFFFFFTHHSRKHRPVVEKAAVLHQLLVLFCNCLATAKSFLLHPPPPSIIWHNVECTLVWWASPCFRYQRALPQDSSAVCGFIFVAVLDFRKLVNEPSASLSMLLRTGTMMKSQRIEVNVNCCPPLSLITDGDETVWSATWLLWAPPTVTSAPVVK